MRRAPIPVRPCTTIVPLLPPDESVMDFPFAPPVPASLPIRGEARRFPVHRVYCIGRNYGEHVREMGGDTARSTPVFFMKPADALWPESDVPHPGATSDLHHEVEMVAALHRGGRDIAAGDALDHVYGYGVGLDLTRRDLQNRAKADGAPWDSAKGFDASAPVSALVPAGVCGHPRQAALTLEVNGALRQQADIAQMIWTLPEIIHELSRLWTLQPGDVIFTGTPAGVGPLVRGDRWRAALGAIATLEGRLV